MEPTRVLITTPLEGDQVARIAAAPGVRLDHHPELLPSARYPGDHGGDPAFRRDAHQEATFHALLGEAEVLFDLPRGLATKLPTLAPKLRWIHATASGIGPMLAQAGLDRGPYLITNSAGVHALPLTEHVLLALLYFIKRIPETLVAQTEHRWARHPVGELYGRTVLIVGLGAIGRQLGQTLRGLGVRVLGVRRSPIVDPHAHGVDEAFTPDALPELLPRADALVLIAPQNASSVGMIGPRELAALPRGAVLVNIGRGVLVDTPALVTALIDGQLGGAALDVTDPEPLPAEHPLWSAPNVLITPHSAATVARENARIVDLFLENLRRYRAGQELLNRWRP
jgi:glyoxylate/hydroxypyruvate reductase